METYTFVLLETRIGQLVQRSGVRSRLGGQPVPGQTPARLGARSPDGDASAALDPYEQAGAGFGVVAPPEPRARLAGSLPGLGWVGSQSPVGDHRCGKHVENR